jgi:D-aminopeptidase
MAMAYSKQRFYKYGIKVGFLEHGTLNSISDVRGVVVGHATKVRGSNVRTGVTIIDPGVKNLYKNKLPAAFYAGNGTGKVAGVSQIEELGTLEAPIGLTNTLAVGAVTQGVIKLVLAKDKLSKIETVNVFVGECNDGILNDIHRLAITEEDVFAAYKAKKKNFDIGNVGAGTGTRAFSWKGGIGTSSRTLSLQRKKFTIGVLVQTNYGGSLVIKGVPLGKIFKKNDYEGIVPDTDGSCMVIVATDAPLTSRQLRRVAKRSFMGLAQTGTIMRSVSGDFALGFSTSRAGLEGSGSVGKCLNDSQLTGIFLATAEATEEAVYDALFAAETMRGRDGNILQALPKKEVLELLKKHEI